jgi:hypothetical protein
LPCGGEQKRAKRRAAPPGEKVKARRVELKLSEDLVYPYPNLSLIPSLSNITTLLFTVHCLYLRGCRLVFFSLVLVLL